MKTFLTDKDEQLLVDAIERAESGTTGEIRLHLEYTCKGDPLERAQVVFHELEMDQTAARNGVLLYIAIDDHKLAIYGDAGISDQVEDSFWQDELDKLINYFKKDQFEEGIEAVIADIGEKLQHFFPGDGSDPNELGNEISYGD